MEAEFERDYNEITCNTSYQSPILKKYVLTINNSVYYDCGIHILDWIDVTYQQEFMSNPKNKYYNALLDTLLKENNLRGEPFSNENIQKAVGKVIEEMEAEFERN